MYLDPKPLSPPKLIFHSGGAGFGSFNTETYQRYTANSNYHYVPNKLIISLEFGSRSDVKNIKCWLGDCSLLRNQRQLDLSPLPVVLFQSVEVKPEWPESISSDKNTHFSHQLWSVCIFLFFLSFFFNQAKRVTTTVIMSKEDWYWRKHQQRFLLFARFHP